MTAFKRWAWYLGAAVAWPVMFALMVDRIPLSAELAGLPFVVDAETTLIFGISTGLFTYGALRLGAPRGITHAFALATVALYAFFLLPIAWPVGPKVTFPVVAGELSRIFVLGVVIPSGFAYLAAWWFARSRREAHPLDEAAAGDVDTLAGPA